MTLDATPSEAPTAKDFNVTVGEESIEVTDVAVAEDGVTVTLTVDLSEKAGVLTVNGTAAAEEINFVTPAEAIAAYEAATISTYADVAVVEELEVAAQTAVDAVTDETVKAELQAQLDAQTANFDEQLAGIVESVTTAGSTIQTKAPLDAFGFEYETLTVGDLASLQAVTTVQGIQAYFSAAQFDELVAAAVELGATANLTTVDDLKLYTALVYGVEKGLLTGVNFDKYFTTYVTTIEGLTDAVTLSADYIQTNVIDTAAQETVNNAVNAVTPLTAASSTQTIAAAQALVDVVDATSTFVDDRADLIIADVVVEVKGQNVKTALTAIIDDIKSAKPVYDVIVAAGNGAINQSKLNTALQNAGVDRAYEDYIVEYATALKAAVTAPGGALTAVDSLSEIQDVIDGANDAVAERLVDVAEADPSAENVAAAQAAIDRLAPDVEGSRTKVADLKADLDAVVQASADLVEALTNAEGALAEGVGQAEIDAAQALVTALPGELTETDGEGQTVNTAKGDLQDAIAAAQELLDVAAINTAITDGNVTALQSIIVGLSNPKFAGLSSAQRAELGSYIIVQAQENETTFDSTAEFSEAISESTTGYVDSYIADITAFNTAANKTLLGDGSATDATTKQGVINAIEKVTGADYLTGLTAVQKLDLAEAILEAKPETGSGYAAKTIAQIKTIVDANRAQ